jgi:hypothetical protein
MSVSAFSPKPHWCRQLKYSCLEHREFYLCSHLLSIALMDTKLISNCGRCLLLVCRTLCLYIFFQIFRYENTLIKAVKYISRCVNQCAKENLTRPFLTSHNDLPLLNKLPFVFSLILKVCWKGLYLYWSTSYRCYLSSFEDQLKYLLSLKAY